jgi:ketosteroid isomerase-like protein
MGAPYPTSLAERIIRDLFPIRFKASSHSGLVNDPRAIRRDKLPPMAHSLEATIRAAYAAFGRGDIDGYLQPCAEDFAFHVPGYGGIAGTYVGRDGLYDLAGKAMAITGGTFSEEVEDVLVNDSHAVVLARHRFTRDDSLKDYRTAHVYEISEGKLSRCFEQPRDPASFDDAWGSSQV